MIFKCYNKIKIKTLNIYINRVLHYNPEHGGDQSQMPTSQINFLWVFWKENQEEPEEWVADIIKEKAAVKVSIHCFICNFRIITNKPWRIEWLYPLCMF